MSEKKANFIQQAAILAVGGLIVRFIGFLYRVPLTSMIGDEGNAVYAQGYYLYTLFLIISSAGLPAAISKMVSERVSRKEYRNADRVLRVSLRWAGMIGLTASLTLGFGAKWFARSLGDERSYYAILTLSPTIFIVALAAVYRGYFQGMGNTTPTTVSQLIEQIFNAVFSVLLAYLLMKGSQDVALGAAGGTAGTGIGALAGLLTILGVYAMAAPKFKQKAKADKNIFRAEPPGKIAGELLKTAAPVIVGTAIFSITNLIDMKMVQSRLAASGAFTSEEISKMYGILTGKYVTLTNLPVAISTALATAAIPSIASSAVLHEQKKVRRKINVALRLTMLISIPAAVGMGVLSNQILLLLYPKYPEGGALLRIGAIAIIFLALTQICTGMLQGIGKVEAPAIAALCGGLLKIPVNYFLIANPKININGAIISTICCYIAASGINLVMLSKTTRMIPDLWNGFIKPLIASGVMGLGCYVSYHLAYMVFQRNTPSCIVAIIASVLLYVLYMLLMKGFKKEDLQMIPKGERMIAVLEKYNLI